MMASTQRRAGGVARIGLVRKWRGRIRPILSFVFRLLFAFASSCFSFYFGKGAGRGVAAHDAKRAVGHANMKRGS